MDNAFTYSLKHYFEEAQITPIPECFEKIGIWHKKKGWIKPLWHQITGLNGAFSFSRYGVFDKMGTGKSLIAHAYGAWHALNNNRPVCLMTPILMPQFRDNFFITFPGIEEFVDMIIYHGTQKQREKIAQKLVNYTGNKFPIIITTPEIFRFEFPLFTQLGCQVVVGDEVDWLSNPDTKAALALKIFMGDYGDKCSMIMTGTPAKKDLTDLYGYIRFLTPDAYRSRTHFDHKHVEYVKVPVRFGPGDDDVRQVRRVKQFHDFELLYSNMYRQARRVEKEEVLDLDDCQIIPMPIYLAGKHKQKYDEFCLAKVMLFPDGTAISGEISSTMRNIAMQAVMQPEILQVNEESTVLAMCDELIKDIGVNDEKIFIGAYYHKTVEKLVARYAQYGALSIYGPNGSAKNTANKNTFINDPACRILVANYESGGVGLDGLQDVCCYAIAAEPTSIPGDFEQFWNRLHRSGQNKKVIVYCIQVIGTIWVKATKSMIERTAWIKQTVSRAQLIRELRGEDEDAAPLQA